MIQTPSPSRLLYFWLCAVVYLCTACAGSSSPSIQEGHWVGEVISFYVVEGELRDIVVMNSSCSGEDALGKACGISINNELTGRPLSISDDGFKGLLFDDGTRRFSVLAGTFTGDDHATGIYQLNGAGCCVDVGNFEVHLEQPMGGPPPPVDAGGSEDAAPPDDVGNQNTDSGVIVVKGVDPIDSECAENAESTTYGGCSPLDAESYQLDAVTEMNRIRAYVGIQPMDAHASINQAAQAHCECFVAHYGDVYQAQGMNPHKEDPTHDDCVAADFWGRMTHFGYPGNPSGEIMGFMASPVGATHGWMETLYHRIPIIDPNSFEMGYGMAASGETGCDTADFSTFDGTDASYEVIYPVHGQSGVATKWLGYESPQPPLPEGESYPSGPIITITVPRGVSLVVDTYALLHANGTEVPSMFTSPSNNSHLNRTTSIYSVAPLDAMTTYTVELGGTKGNSAWARTWSFTTGPSGANWDYAF